MTRNGLASWSSSETVADVLARPWSETPAGRLIYAIHDGSGVLYIGQTQAPLGQRLYGHAVGPQAREFCRLMNAARAGDRRLMVCWTAHASGLEGRLIGAVRPKFNKLHPRWINVHGRDLAGIAA